jgi:hypothetical protein
MSPTVCLIVGNSFSGKTTLAKKLLAKEKRVYVVNSDGSFSDFERVDWSEVDGLSNCQLLFEDLINISPTQFSCLQKLLNKQQHHNGIDKVFLICHSVHNNNIFGLMPHLSKVYFTLSKNNVTSLGTVLARFRYNKKQKEKFESEFLASRGTFGHFVLDNDKRTFTPGIIDSEGQQHPSGGGDDASMASGTPEDPGDPSRYFALMKDERRARLLFESIYPRLPEGVRDKGSFLLTLKSKKLDAAITVNFMDYLDCLTDPAKKPDNAMYSLHKYVVSKYSVPACLVKNINFRK